MSDNNENSIQQMNNKNINQRKKQKKNIVSFKYTALVIQLFKVFLVQI